jgi:hypothetical protein
MRRLAALSVLPLACCGSRELVLPVTGVLKLSGGVIEVHREMALPPSAHDLEIDGAGATLRAARDFRGRAIFTAKAGARIHFRDFTIDGNRDALEQRQGLPGYDTPFRAFTANNGILIEGCGGVTVSGVHFLRVAGFPILVSGSKQVRIEGVNIADSGSRNAAGKNNTTGGILLEEGSSDFQVLDCELKNIRGNGIWTHSLYTSPRNVDGLIARNRFDEIARDAIQVGHATRIKVQSNSGSRIGFPESLVDAIPVAIDTAGNVDHSAYSGNDFSGINGKCIDLDGFHDGEVTGNRCLQQANFGIVMNNTNPDMQSQGVTIERNLIDGGQYGGIFVIGGPNRILGNQLRHLNLSHSGDGLLRSGIYLGRGAERPAVARGNVIEGNEVSGFGMKKDCIGADPAVQQGTNRIAGNQCRESLP